jgi:hypothetical protein
MCFLGIACHEAAPSRLLDAGAMRVPDEASAVLVAAEPERGCHVEKAAALPGFVEGDDLEFGEAVRSPAGAFVGLLRSSGGTTLASVARVEGQAAASLVDLGAAVADAPPPQPFLRGAEVFAAGYVRGAQAEAGAHLPPRAVRPLSVFRVGDVAERLVTLTQTSDESPSFDVAAGIPGGSIGALLAWDEDAPEGHRGLVRVAVLSPDLRAIVRAAVASPETTDAERPGLAVRAAGGYWLAWIARKAEPPRDAGPELEGPSEDRAYRWIELVALDVDGRPVGPVRRLTSATGHVSGFSMETHFARLDLYGSQDDEPTDGAGGGIVHVAVDVNGLASVAPIVASGTARGVTPIVMWERVGPQFDEDGGHLAYLDLTDHTRLVRLDRTGSERATATLEPDLDDARLLAAEPEGHFFVAAPRPESSNSVFRWLRCAEPSRPPP